MMTEITAEEVLRLSENEVKTSTDRPKLIRMLRVLWAHNGNDPQALRALIPLDTPTIAGKLWEQIARNGGGRRGAPEEVPYDPQAATPPPMPAPPPPPTAIPPGTRRPGGAHRVPDLHTQEGREGQGPPQPREGRGGVSGPSTDEIRELVKEAVVMATVEMTKHIHELKGEVAVLLEENRELSRKVTSFGGG
jgi:hypothetical protein